MITKPVQVAHSKESVFICANNEYEIPNSFTRLGSFKFNFLINIAQISRTDQVLELFGGSNLGTALITNKVKPSRITTLDWHYNNNLDWWYAARENYRQHTDKDFPNFVTASATDIPFDKESFDVVLLPDSPRGIFGLGEEQNKHLFQRSLMEAIRVVKYGGVIAGTAKTSWINLDAKLINGSKKANFKICNDPIVYFRWSKK